jgi:16S rRNA (guanine(527)-N(7))-methyltransferase RsmG
VAYLDILKSELQEFGIDVPESQKISLAAYCDELVRWNEKINLTALAGEKLVQRLVVEPVWIAQALKLSGSLLDIGSGNGSPAIPFQIVCPYLRCDLVEARAKRAAFLRHLCLKLKLPGATIYRAKYEDVAPVLSQPDWITLQAVALTPQLFNVIRGFVRATTTIVWITAGNIETTLGPVESLSVPITGTRVLLFRLDLP